MTDIEITYTPHTAHIPADTLAAIDQLAETLGPEHTWRLDLLLTDYVHLVARAAIPDEDFS